MTSTWLQRKRHEAGYTQLGFVQALNEAGIKKQQSIVSVWENTGQLPSTILGDPQQLMQIAKLLKVSVSDILNQYGYTDLDLNENIPEEINFLLTIYNPTWLIKEINKLGYSARVLDSHSPKIQSLLELIDLYQ